MTDETPRETFTFNLNEGTAWAESSTVEVWYDGKERDPATEEYRQRYAYKITTSKWSYDGNDIYGPANANTTVDKAAQSLFAFLYACQEGMPKRGRFEVNESADLFPEHVREWAYLHSDELSIAGLEQEAKGLSDTTE